MKERIYWLVPVLILAFACNLPTATVEPGSVMPPEASATDTPQEAAVIDTPTVAAVATPNVTCNEITLTLDPALASGFECKTIPAAGSPSDPGFSVNPQYTEVTLKDYILGSTFFTPHIDVYPVQDFSALVPGLIDADVAALQALLGGGPLPAKGALPLLPVANAAEEFHAKYKVLSFSGGSGIRYLTQYAQFYDPINNKEMFYSFQGLSADGRYWISAFLPISNSMLPANGDNPPNGWTADQFQNQFDTYLSDIKDKLSNQPPNTYSPTIAALDALATSISIQP